MDESLSTDFKEGAEKESAAADTDEIYPVMTLNFSRRLIMNVSSSRTVSPRGTLARLESQSMLTCWCRR